GFGKGRVKCVKSAAQLQHGLYADRGPVFTLQFGCTYDKTIVRFGNNIEFVARMHQPNWMVQCDVPGFNPEYFASYTPQLCAGLTCTHAATVDSDIKVFQRFTMQQGQGVKLYGGLLQALASQMAD